MAETNTNYNEAIIALKNEYEEKLAVMEAECALLRSEIQQGEDERKRIMDENEAYLEEYVDVKLFRDSDRYCDDVYVAVNGQNCIIKRGEWVKIKRKFALVLDQSEIQDIKTGEYIASVCGAAE
ncbi:MAG: hypothetical protein E7667_02520 [Ruminococcaceae bacterium]|nr:hypothetical protein [Oscillospiraceae bacterium]